MKIQYDKTADAVYIHMKKGKIFKTIKMKDRLIVDTDKEGKIIGLEILGVSMQIPKRQLKEIKIGSPVFCS
jgi:uncharacterized protein YuzE